MPELDIEAVVDKLLVYMVEEMEVHGATTNTASFDFDPGQEHHAAFVKRYPELEPVVSKVMNICISRGLVWHTTLCSTNCYLGMTTAGQARALSVKLRKSDQPMQPTFHIGAITSHAPMQIGNGNAMSIEAFYAAAISRIDAADAPPEQKAEAKSLLGQMFEHPLLCSVLGGIAGGLAL